MPIDWSAIEAAGGIGKPSTRYRKKQEKRSQQAAAYSELCAYVTQRDGSCCRVCKKWCNPRAIGMLEKLHHHHIEYRSRGGMDTKENLCVVCARCHADIHDARLRLEGDAEERNEMGKLAGIKVSRMEESGWIVKKCV